MLRLALAAVLLVPAVAAADVDATVSAGAGAQATDAYATASAHLDVSSRPDVIYTGVRATADALLDANTTIAAFDVGARAAGLGLSLGAAYQPVGDLRDVFWRSGRGVTALTIGFPIPGLGYDYGDGRTIHVCGMTAAYTSLARGGYTAHLDLALVSYVAPAWQLRVLQLEVDGFGVVAQVTDTTRAGLVANDKAFDVARIAWRPAVGWQVSLSGGVDTLEPTAPYASTSTSDTYSDPAVEPPGRTLPRYWAELGRHATDGSAWHLGAGSWARLDPTGYAADAGQLAEAGASGNLGRAQLAARVQGGELRRVLVTAGAPADVAPPGTVMRMGRTEVSATVPIARHLELAGSAWAERSDRDDPRWLVPADGKLATHAGVDVAARYTFRRGARR